MNPPSEEEKAGRAGTHVRRHSFRPVLLFLLIGLPLLAWDYHRRNAPRTFISGEVTLEGGPLENALEVIIDGRPHDSHQPVAIGRRDVRIRSRDADEWSTNLFVWYGSNPVGDVRLRRSRGDLKVAVSPVPLLVTIHGRLTNTVTQVSDPFFKNLPVGDYRIGLRFQHFQRELRVAVTANAVKVVDQSFPAGHLKIESEPAGAVYELQGEQGDRVGLKGEVPGEIAFLPAGDYRLEMARGDYRLIRKVKVEGGETNLARVVFSYGRLDIATEPVAKITLNHRAVGTTPLQMENLVPGQYRVSADAEGFHPADWTVDIRGDESVTLRTNLLSRRYTEAMTSARIKLTGFGRDYRGALVDLDEALAAKPGDEEAARLKPEVLFQAHQQEARKEADRGRLSQALASVETALQLKPGSPEATGLKAEIQRKIQEAEQRAAEMRKQNEAREARLKMEREAEMKRQEEARLADMRRREEQQRQAEMRRLSEQAASRFTQLLGKLPGNYAHVRWTSKASPAEVEAALQKSIGTVPNGWSHKGTDRQDGISQIHLAGLGVAEGTRRAVVQLSPLVEGSEARVVFYKVGDQDNIGTLAGILRERLQKQLGKEIR